MSSLEDKLDNALTSGDDGTEVSRRLSDKILNAFNHAYAVGENEIAGFPITHQFISDDASRRRLCMP